LQDDAYNIVCSVEDQILPVIENVYKFKNYGAKNLLQNFLAKVGQFLV